MSKRYIITKGKDLGLLHTEIIEFYSIPENLKLIGDMRFGKYTPNPKDVHLLMFGNMFRYEELKSAPPYYYVLPLRKEDFSEIEGIDWYSVKRALDAKVGILDERKYRQKWDALEMFEEKLLGGHNLIHAIPVNVLDHKTGAKPKKVIHRVSKNS